MTLLWRWFRAGMVGLLILLVRAYQVTLSPILGWQCRFIPSCSQYFIQAVHTRGPVVGLALGLWRIIRCHPFSKGGYDPVPERTKRRGD